MRVDPNYISNLAISLDQAQANQEQLNYFPNRRIWYVDRSSGSVIMPYATAIALSHPADALLPDAR